MYAIPQMKLEDIRTASAYPEFQQRPMDKLVWLGVLFQNSMCLLNINFGNEVARSIHV